MPARRQPLATPGAGDARLVRHQRHPVRRICSAVTALSALVSACLWLAWTPAPLGDLELEHRIDIKTRLEMQKLIISQDTAAQPEAASAVLELSTLMHIAMPHSPSMASDMAKMVKADLLDVLGTYSHLSGSSSEPNRSVYQRLNDQDTHMWHAEGSGWYCGPKKHLGTTKGLLHATNPSEAHQYKEPPGGRHEPVQEGFGWRAALDSGAGHFEPTSVEVLNRDEYFEVMSHGARQLQLWPDGRTPPLKFGVPSQAYFGRPQMAGVFTWSPEHLLDGRPVYIMGHQGVELAGRTLTLWYSAALESWCVGMVDLSVNDDGLEHARDEWDRCELRARDAALLPEWITQPWQMLDDDRAFARVRTKDVVLYYGVLQVGDTPARYTDPPSTFRVRRLPLQEEFMDEVAEWWAPRLLATCVAVLLSLWFHALRALAGSWYGMGRRFVERATQPKKARPRRRKATEGATDEPEWWLELNELHEALDDAAKAEKPSYCCPLSLEIMRNPALLSDGRSQGQHIYEYDQAKKWVDEYRTEPTTRAKLRDPKFTVNGPLQREIRSWCQEKAAVLQQGPVTPPPQPVVRKSIHVFIDHSNVAIGATRSTGKELDVKRLVHRVEARRNAKERVVVGSHESERTATEWKKLGYTVVADPRRGKERFVDDALHAQLMRAASKSFDPGRVLLLVTGDGNSNEGRTTFPECVMAAMQNDWHVELYSWRQSLNKVYVELAEQHASHFSIHFLEDVYADW